MFDIDWQGTRQIVEKLPNDVVTVFILPPSMKELKARLERRAEDTPEAIARRLAMRATRSSGGRNTTTSSSTRTWIGPIGAAGDPGRGTPEARARIGLPDFVDGLLNERLEAGVR